MENYSILQLGGILLALTGTLELALAAGVTPSRFCPSPNYNAPVTRL